MREHPGVDLVHRLGPPDHPLAVSLPLALDLGDLQQLVGLVGCRAQRAARPAVERDLLEPAGKGFPLVSSVLTRLALAPQLSWKHVSLWRVWLGVKGRVGL